MKTPLPTKSTRTASSPAYRTGRLWLAASSFFIILIFLQHSSLAQSPQSFKYQSVARNSNGLPIASTNIGLRISVHDLTATGSVVYRETHTAATNAFGVFSVSVGGGAVVSGNFSTIAWGSGAKYIEVEADFAGGSSYTSMGTSQLLSVPYALYSQNGTPGPAGAQGPIGLTGAAGANGTNGTNGSVGATGPQGPIGLTGPVGTTGAQGAAGAAGNDGLTTSVNGVTQVAGAITLTKSDIGLGNVDNTTDANKPVSTAAQTALDLKAPLASPTFTGTVVANTIQLTGGSPAAGKVLTSDATGVATWQAAGGGGGWGLTGTSGTIDGTNFIGTTDNVPLNFKVNNEKAGRIDLANTALGVQALQSITVGSGNTGIGSYVLPYSTDDYNTAIGRNAFSNLFTGSNNTAIGNNANVFNDPSEVWNNATSIGANSIVTASNAIQLGDAAVTQVFAGTGTTATLITGGLKVTGGTPAVGKVLTSDGTGVATWQTAGGGGGWGLTGSAGTVDGTNFIGTTDSAPLNFKVGDEKAGRIDQDGRVFIGYQAGNNNTAFDNTGIGFQALFSNTTGGNNTANGYNALYNNSTGNNNTANGHYSLYNNGIGNDNTANGVSALSDNTTGSMNTANGEAALQYNKTGSNATAFGTNAMRFANNTTSAFTNYNVAVGFEALRGSTDASANTGNYNSALGYQTLWSNTSGNYNTANGWSALYFNTTGNNNTATGFGSLYSNTTGQKNASHGQNALYSNLSGAYNTASGSNALYSNTIGNNNTSVGEESLYYSTGSDNTALGFSAGLTITSGSNNTVIGRSADVSSGAIINATAIGNGATATASNAIQLGNASVTEVRMGTGNTATVVTGGLKVTGGTLTAGKVLTSDGTGVATWQTTGWGLTGNAGLTGANFIGTTDNIPFNIRVNNQKAGGIDANSSNTFYGYQSGNSNSGIGNTANGYFALRSNTNGSSNTANGDNALNSNTDGNNNTANGANALYYNTTGTNNTANGMSALFNTTGNNNTALGRNAGSSITTGSNNIAIGFNAQVAVATSSNQIRMGDGSIGLAQIQVAWNVTSDRRWKSDIKQSNLGLDFITKLKPVSYFRNNDESKKREYGFIAQELEETLNASGAADNGIISKDDKGMYSVRYNDLMAPMVKAIQEQQLLIQDLKFKIEKMEQEALGKNELVGKLETENALLKTSHESRLKKIEEMLGAKARK